MELNTRMLHIFLLCLLFLSSTAQPGIARENRGPSLTYLYREETAARQQTPPPAQKPEVFMHYKVIEGDTVFVETLRPSYVWAWTHTDSKDWRRYYKLVHNFSRTYPYAQLARKVVRQTDEVFESEHMTEQQRQKYVDKLQKDIIYSFEDVLRHMTITQGKLLIKLIDREVGMSSYDIIKNYKNGIAAKFWNGIANMFNSDLKKGYDPTGEDKDIEELIQVYDRGDFPFLYFSIFGKYPKVPVMPSKFR